MQKRSQISLLKSLLRHPFQLCSKPRYGFFIPSLKSRVFSNSLIPSSSQFFHSSTSNLYLPTHPLGQNVHNWSSICTNLRKHSSASGDLDVNKEVDTINLKFAEAREEIEMAMESKETVYFDEEAECARAAVREVLDMFEGLLGKVAEDQKAALQRSMGLKIEQLKAELQILDD